MIFCKRRSCPARQVTEFNMQLSGLKWKVKNFPGGELYVSLGAYDEVNTVRIAPGAYDILIDRDPQTATRRTSRLIQVYAEAEGEVEVMYA